MFLLKNIYHEFEHKCELKVNEKRITGKLRLGRSIDRSIDSGTFF